MFIFSDEVLFGGRDAAVTSEIEEKNRTRMFVFSDEVLFGGRDAAITRKKKCSQDSSKKKV